MENEERTIEKERERERLDGEDARLYGNGSE